MALGDGTRQWVRGTLAKIAASSAVLGSGELLVDEAGGVYGGDGTTQLSALKRLARINEVLTPAAAAAAYARLPVNAQSGLTGMWHADGYGAKGNASNDDTAAIQAAIDAAAANSRGGIVYLKPGIFMISGLYLRSGVTLLGAGHNATQLRLINGANQHGIQLLNARQEQVGIRSLRLSGNKSNQVGTWHGIYFSTDSATNSYFASGFLNAHHVLDDLIVDKWSGDGLNFGGDAFSGEVHCSNVFSYGNARYGYSLSCPDSYFDRCIAGSNGGHGFFLPSATNTRLVNCKAWYSGQSDLTGSGFHVTASRTQLIGCEAQDNANNGFTLDGVSQCVASGCTADSNGTGTNPAHGFALLNSATFNNLTGVTYDRQATPMQAFGLRLDAGANSNIVDLTIGAVLTGGVSGSLGNNRVRITRGAGAARENFYTNLEFNADNTYDIGTSAQRARDLRIGRNAFIGGGLLTAVAFTGAATYTVGANDSVILNNQTANTTTLPAAATALRGRLYFIRNIATSGSMTVNTAGGNVDNATSANLAAGASGRYVCDGSNWWST